MSVFKECECGLGRYFLLLLCGGKGSLYSQSYFYGPIKDCYCEYVGTITLFTVQNVSDPKLKEFQRLLLPPCSKEFSIKQPRINWFLVQFVAISCITLPVSCIVFYVYSEYQSSVLRLWHLYNNFVDIFRRIICLSSFRRMYLRVCPCFQTL